LRLEINGSWCIPVPKMVSPRLRQRVSSTPTSIVPSGQKVAITSRARASKRSSIDQAALPKKRW